MSGPSNSAEAVQRRHPPPGLQFSDRDQETTLTAEELVPALPPVLSLPDRPDPEWRASQQYVCDCSIAPSMHPAKPPRSREYLEIAAASCVPLRDSIVSSQHTHLKWLIVRFGSLADMPSPGAACLLHPRKQTSEPAASMSAMGHNRT